MVLLHELFITEVVDGNDSKGLQLDKQLKKLVLNILLPQTFIHTCNTHLSRGLALAFYG